MLSLARLCFLLLSASLLFNVSLAANLQYNMYNGTSCAGNTISSGQDNSPTYTSTSGLNSWTGSCIAVNSVSGIGSAKLNCQSGSATSTSGQFFSDSACTTANLVGSAISTTGSGSCTAVSPAPAGLSASVTITCNGNGAFAMAALSLPLLAILALLATLSM